MAKKAKRRTLLERAEECAERLLPEDYWFQWAVNRAYIAGYRAAQRDARR